MIGFESLIDLADKLGVIHALKGKLIREPGPATDELITVLEEIRKIYGSIETELSKYLALWFDPASLSEERAVLVALEGGEIRARMGEARGHCHKITNIYDHYLTTWFDRVLSSDESTMMADLFSRLREFDNEMLDSIDELADWLTVEATNTLNRVDAGDLDGSNQRIQAARKEVLGSRRAISKAMRDLFDLQAEFIEVSGAL